METREVNVTSEQSWEDAVDVGEQVILGGVGVVMALVGGVGNGVVVALVCCSPAMRSAINILLATVALCDTLATVLLLPLDLVSLIGRGWLLPAPLCHAHAFLMNVVQTEGVAILTVICVDRYIIIVRRQDRLTVVLAYWVIVVSWVVSACVAALPFLGVGGYSDLPLPPGLTHCQWQPTTPTPLGEKVYASVRFLMAYLLPLVIMFSCFTNILGKVRSNLAKVHCGACEGGSSYTELVEVARETELPKPSTTLPSRPLVTVNLRYKNQTLTTIMTLFFTFVVCRTPLHLTQLVQSLTCAGEAQYEVYPWLLWWTYVQPAINPVIYTARIQKFRKELLEMFPWLRRLTPGPEWLGQCRNDPSSIYMIQRHPRRATSS
ncbi:probable G-protein coupled receptor 63 [Panulirus ornatus]|uniref:probable G-protein coupled receptor 63 n=1 Tax=Panulirus ornatus TaxID=150431 RepID=UPI003A8A5081